jgi:hypothetical protein
MCACSTCSSGVTSRSCKTLPSRKNVGGHKPTKIAKRSARACASLSDFAAERPQKCDGASDRSYAEAVR